MGYDSVVESGTNATPLDARLLLTALGIGLVAAIGTALVALGLTDLLAYADGYRPSHWMVSSYATALAVMTAGWSLLVGGALWTVHTVSLVR